MIRCRLIGNYLRNRPLFCVSRLPYSQPKCIVSRGFASLVPVEEFSRRRLALATELGRYVSRTSNTNSKHLLIFPASEVQYMAYHVPYPFHQDSNFLYFTGFLEANAVFALTVLVEPSHNRLEPQIRHQEHLFVEVRSPHAELWDGPTLGIDNSIHCTGIRSVHDLQDFSQFLDANHSDTVIWYSHLVQRPTESQTPNKFVLSEVLKLQRRTQKSAREIKNPDPIVDNLRLIKSPTEVNLLQKAAAVTSDCIMATMRFSRPGLLELGLLGVLECEARLHGSSLGYPPVIAGGSRAHIIHYLKNDQILNSGDLVLVDCGCRYGGYTADITRTWPVNGQTFESEARGGVPQVNPLPRHKRPGSIRSYRSLNSDITNRPRLSPTVLPPISSAFHVPSGDNCFLRPRQLVNIGAFNVRTLRQIGQQAALASTLSSLELDVCCVSETRVYDSSTVIHLSSPLDSCRSKRFCLRVSGDAEAESHGRAGVGIALSSRAEQCLLDWIPVNSRLCAVRLNTSVKVCRRKSERRCVFIISAYAPTDSCPDAAKDAFYDALVDLLRQSKHSDIIILAGDFNAQLGRLSSDEKRLGGMFGVRAQRTDNGERLLQLCASHGLYISSTAFQHRKKHCVTWRPPCASQPWTQLDHIAVSYRWRHSVKDCRAFWSNPLDSDHAVVRARFVLSFAQRTYARKCKVFNWHSSDEDVKNAYQKALAKNLPSSSQMKDPSEHWGQIAEVVKACCEQARSEGAVRFRQNWISVTSINLMNQRRSITPCSDYDDDRREFKRKLTKSMRKDQQFSWPQPDHVDDGTRLVSYCIPDGPPSEAQVVLELKLLKRNKAPGPDLLSPSLFKNGGLRESQIREEQAGFRSGRVCVDHIFTLRRVLKHRQPTVVVFLDLKAAFDSTAPNVLWSCLLRKGAPEKYVNLLRSLYAHSASRVRVYGQLSRAFITSSGVRQGCPILPLQFNFVMDDIFQGALCESSGPSVELLPGARLTNLKCADDIVLLSFSAENMQTMLNKLSDRAGLYGMRFTPSKCKVLPQDWGISTPTFFIADNPLESVDSFTYLGSTISSVCNNVDEISARIAKARVACAKLRDLWRREDVPLSLKRRVYNTYVHSTLLYSPETWPVRRQDINKRAVFDH
ncbi:uncharacterized protein DEA37_0004723, partial [Paragonimus westermani]